MTQIQLLGLRARDALRAFEAVRSAQIPAARLSQFPTILHAPQIPREKSAQSA
jgi:hypothetical protein